MNSSDRLFEEVFRGELEMEHREHLGYATLWAYASSGLEPELAEKVSLHLASCGRCTAELRAIRAEHHALTDGASRLLPDPLQRIPLARQIGKTIASNSRPSEALRARNAHRW